MCGHLDLGVHVFNEIKEVTSENVNFCSIIWLALLYSFNKTCIHNMNFLLLSSFVGSGSYLTGN